MCSSNQSRSLSVVLIDDNEDHLYLMSRSVQEALCVDGFVVNTSEFTDPATGLAEISQDENQVVLIDYQFAGTTGVDWIRDFVQANVGPVILVTSSGDEKVAAEAFRAGASDYVIKSEAISSPLVLRRSIHEALRKHSLEHTNQELTKRLKIANTELQNKNRKLSELTETAHRFVEDVAHEFRTPLTVIKEFAAIMNDGLGGEVTAKQAQYLNYMSESASDLAGLVDDFLNSSRLRSNSICVDRREHTVESLLESVWPMLESRAGLKSIELVQEVEDEVPSIYVDTDKAQRSLINLVVNAIKFSESGEVVRVSIKRTDMYSVSFGVHDSGPGLPEESVNELFERFNQGTSGSHQLASGFGLGLNIVKSLVAINLGAVDVSSEIGVGSCFSFSVPVANNRSIVRGLVSQAQSQKQTRPIVALSARRKRHDQAVDQLIHDLELLSYPMDLILKQSNTGMPVLIGITDDAEALQSRLCRVDQEECSNKSKQLSGLDLEICGVWPVHQAEEQLIALLEAPAAKEMTRAS